MPEPYSRRRALAGGIGIAATLAATTSLSPAAFADISVLVEPEELPWPEARTIVADTTVPTFPSTVINVRDHGAVADAAPTTPRPSPGPSWLLTRPVAAPWPSRPAPM